MSQHGLFSFLISSFPPSATQMIKVNTHTLLPTHTPPRINTIIEIFSTWLGLACRLGRLLGLCSLVARGSKSSGIIWFLFQIWNRYAAIKCLTASTPWGGEKSEDERCGEREREIKLRRWREGRGRESKEAPCEREIWEKVRMIMPKYRVRVWGRE